MDERPPEYFASRKYSPEIPPKGNKSPRWEAWLRIFLSFLLGAFSAAFFAGGKSRDLSDLLTWKGEVNTKFERIDDEFKILDREGTNKSKWVDETQEREIQYNAGRITDLEKKSEQRQEVINVLTGKVERLESELKASEERNRK